MLHSWSWNWPPNSGDPFRCLVIGPSTLSWVKPGGPTGGSTKFEDHPRLSTPSATTIDQQHESKQNNSVFHYDLNGWNPLPSVGRSLQSGGKHQDRFRRQTA